MKLLTVFPGMGTYMSPENFESTGKEYLSLVFFILLVLVIAVIWNLIERRKPKKEAKNK